MKDMQEDLWVGNFPRNRLEIFNIKNGEIGEARPSDRLNTHALTERDMVGIYKLDPNKDCVVVRKPTGRPFTPKTPSL